MQRTAPPSRTIGSPHLGQYIRYFGLAISSMAEALRWRAVGRCASQQAMLQNISFTRPELQVETEQRKYLVSSGIGFLHIEHTAKGGAISAA